MPPGHPHDINYLLYLLYFTYCYVTVCRVLQSVGPTNTRRYHVAVYFRGERLATGIGHSIQQAEMNTAKNALRDKAGNRLLVPPCLVEKLPMNFRTILSYL